MVYVALEGHASAYLMSGAKRFELPGELPLGEYDLMGVFQGSTPLKFATVHLTASGHPKVVCHVGFMKCEFFP